MRERLQQLDDKIINRSPLAAGSQVDGDLFDDGAVLGNGNRAGQGYARSLPADVALGHDFIGLARRGRDAAVKGQALGGRIQGKCALDRVPVELEGNGVGVSRRFSLNHAQGEQEAGSGEDAEEFTHTVSIIVFGCSLFISQPWLARMPLVIGFRITKSSDADK